MSALRSPPGVSSANKRTHRRRSIALHLRVHDEASGEYIGRIGDISEGGLLLYGSRTIETREPITLRVELLLPDGRLAALSLKAKPMWSGPDVNPAFIATGLRFVDLDFPEHRAALDLLLTNLTIERDDFDD